MHRCKRVIITDDYYPTLGLPNVSLETRPIHSISSSTVIVNGDSGATPLDTDFDLIVCATGFNTVEFLHPIELTGRKGRKLSDVWSNGAKAYNGTCVEDMPNFGMLYGPNTNLGHNSIILMIEAQSRYINGLIRPVLDARSEGKALSLAPKAERVQEFNAKVQAALQNSSFNDPSCNSWYKNDAGLITNNWSGTAVEYQELLAKVDIEGDYEVEGSGIEVVKRKPVRNVGRVREETYFSDQTLGLLSVLSVGIVAAGWVMRNTKYLNGLRVR